MSANKLKRSIGNAASTTLSSSMTDSQTTTPLTSTTNFQAESGEGMVLIAEGLSNEEFAYATGLSGASLTTPLANRGLEGGSAQAHDAGESVKGILTATMWNDLCDILENGFLATTGAVDTTKLVTPTGTQTLTNKTLTATSNNVAAKSLHSATTVIDVVAATAPTSGQVLTATGGTAATWQTPASSTNAETVDIRRQDNTTNTTPTELTIQMGWGYIQGNGSTALGTKSVTFPTAFSSAPILIINAAGRNTSGAPSAIGDLNAAGDEVVSFYNLTTSGFTANFSNNGANVIATNVYVGFTWIAIGPV